MVSRYGLLMSIIHCGTILLAIIILAAASPQPESVRVKAMRLGKKLGAIFSSSAVPLALALAAVTAAVLFSQCAFSLGRFVENLSHRCRQSVCHFS